MPPEYRGYLPMAAAPTEVTSRLDLAIIILGGAVILGVAVQLFRRYVRK